jgi:hypothetical protein
MPAPADAVLLSNPNLMLKLLTNFEVLFLTAFITMATAGMFDVLPPLCGHVLRVFHLNPCGQSFNPPSACILTTSLLHVPPPALSF